MIIDFTLHIFIDGNCYLVVIKPTAGLYERGRSVTCCECRLTSVLFSACADDGEMHANAERGLYEQQSNRRMCSKAVK